MASFPLELVELVEINSPKGCGKRRKYDACTGIVTEENKYDFVVSDFEQEQEQGVKNSHP